ncbi:hypothetical protein [Neobacillus massiliamazoniensis]|uniref:YjcZ family sporulation protein n=1 Tax=Neobacillus massiliamazoniensis TaxID=1499688 RepID=A0A0U1P1P7_9BACI|nr:hypothetical protein [Neobacillus massiliamazoniensis]CRK84224.1 hypothetical protein BN000_04226 [Neobacillus massiliamazoniensis]
MPNGYPYPSLPSPCCYPAYSQGYAGFGGFWIALAVVVFVLLIVFGFWWWFSCFY